MTTACLVFAKPPRPGMVKTRLGARIGHERAAELAAAMLKDTWTLVSNVDGLSPILATTEPNAEHGLPLADPWDQGEGDLGARVERMLRRGIETHGRAFAIGADAPNIGPEVYRQALGTPVADAVLGKSTDGGFYLLGLSRCEPGLLDDLPWSAPDTAAATGGRLISRGYVVHDLPLGFDIDELADLRRFAREVPRTQAPATFALLQRPSFREFLG
ncbi:MAG: TIGR04282 family arsenosugar biosynthesis glycosyltransferase [Myxococcota bacterium]